MKLLYECVCLPNSLRKISSSSKITQLTWQLEWFELLLQKKERWPSSQDKYQDSNILSLVFYVNCTNYYLLCKQTRVSGSEITSNCSFSTRRRHFCVLLGVKQNGQTVLRSNVMCWFYDLKGKNILALILSEFFIE